MSDLPSPSWTSNDCWHRADYCGMPGPTTTGVRPGTRLRRVGSVTITTAGSRLAALEIDGTLTIKAPGVRVEDCLIRPRGNAVAVSLPYTGVSGVELVHVEIDGGRQNPSVVGIAGSGFVVDAADIHGTGDAIDAGSNVVVQNSWIHDLVAWSGDHTDGIQSSGGRGLRVVNNTIDALGPATNSAILAGADLGPLDRVVIEHNLLRGGNYTVYAGTGGRFDSGSIRISGNRFGSGYRYGPCSLRPAPGRIIQLSGNVDDATGAPLRC
jgi:hypothetical protein